MFVILTYDIKQERVSKACKICRKYLHHIQKSVFEGMITEKKLQQLQRELRVLIQPMEDSVQIYKIQSIKYATKERLGIAKESDNII